MRRGLLATGVAAVLGLVGSLSAGAAQEEPIYLPCLHKERSGMVPKQHPQSCRLEAAGVTGKGETVLAVGEFRKMRWSNWGGARARVEGITVSAIPSNKPPRQSRFHFTVSGRKSCEERVFYAEVHLKDRWRDGREHRETLTILCVSGEESEP